MAGIAIVDSHPGAGKTTLIQRLLESNKSRAVQASRCLARPGSGDWKEERGHLPGKTTSRHAELSKWLEAGAEDANMLTYDPDKIDLESLIPQVDGGFGAWDEWVLEAENSRHPRVHCSVYVLRPLPDSARLVEERESIVAHLPFDEYLRHAGDDLPPQETLEPADDSVEETHIDIPIDLELPERLAEVGVVLNESERNRLRTLIQEGIPIRSKRPALRPECARMPAAEVVIINLHHEDERPLAEATHAQIVGFFKDWKLRSQIEYRSLVTRAGVYLANLQDANDPGTQKALAQIKRKLRGRY